MIATVDSGCIARRRQANFLGPTKLAHRQDKRFLMQAASIHVLN